MEGNKIRNGGQMTIRRHILWIKISSVKEKKHIQVYVKEISESILNTHIVTHPWCVPFKVFKDILNLKEN